MLLRAFMFINRNRVKKVDYRINSSISAKNTEKIESKKKKNGENFEMQNAEKSFFSIVRRQIIKLYFTKLKIGSISYSLLL